jgi:pumilio family protein 6
VSRRAKRQMVSIKVNLTDDTVSCFACSTDKTAAIEALVRPIGQTYPNPASSDPEQDPVTAPILDISYADRAYKTLLAGGRFNSATSSVESANEELRSRFGKAFWQALTSEEAGGEQNAVNLALGNAPFVVVELVDNLKMDEELAPVVKRVLATPEVMGQVEKSWRKGASLLHQKLASL